MINDIRVFKDMKLVEGQCLSHFTKRTGYRYSIIENSKYRVFSTHANERGEFQCKGIDIDFIISKKPTHLVCCFPQLVYLRNRKKLIKNRIKVVFKNFIGEVWSRNWDAMMLNSGVIQDYHLGKQESFR